MSDLIHKTAAELADLLAAGGLYARLWRVQQLEDELANA